MLTWGAASTIGQQVAVNNKQTASLTEHRAPGPGGAGAAGLSQRLRFPVWWWQQGAVAGLGRQESVPSGVGGQQSPGNGSLVLLNYSDSNLGPTGAPPTSWAKKCMWEVGAPFLSSLRRRWKRKSETKAAPLLQSPVPFQDPLHLPSSAASRTRSYIGMSGRGKRSTS